MALTCDCDIDDEPVLWSEEKRRARIEHQCAFCGGTIKPGEHYERFAGVWDCGFESYKMCADCRFIQNEIGRELFGHCGGWSCVTLGPMNESWGSVVDDIRFAGTPQDYVTAIRLAKMQRAAVEARGGEHFFRIPDDEDNPAAPNPEVSGGSNAPSAGAASLGADEEVR